MTANERLEARASEYVLGTLAGEERVAFEQTLRVSQDARAAVALWEELLAGMNDAVPTVEPPPSALKLILTRIGIGSEKLVARWRWLAGLGFATSFVFAGIAAVQFFDSEAGQLRTQVAANRAVLDERDRRFAVKSKQYAERAGSLTAQVTKLQSARDVGQIEVARLSNDVQKLTAAVAEKEKEAGVAREQMQVALAELTTVQALQADALRFKPQSVSLVMDNDTLFWEIHADPSSGLVQVKRVANTNPAAGKDYALWVVRTDGTVRPIGYISKIGKKVFELQAQDLDGVKAFAVSLEKENDELKGAPAGPVVYSGTTNEYRI